MIEIKPWVKRAFDALNTCVSKGNKILDVGCGNGGLLETVHQNFAFCVGIDFSLKSLKNASHLKDVDLIRADATRLPIRDDIMDIVVSSQFFEHVYDVEGALEEQIRVVKGKGKIIVQQANAFSIFTICNLLLIYPLKTKGKRGGLKWIFNHHNNTVNPEFLPIKDEDVKNIIWWRQFICQKLKILDIYTPLSRKLRIDNFGLKIFISVISRGGLIIIAQKIKIEG